MERRTGSVPTYGNRRRLISSSANTLQPPNNILTRYIPGWSRKRIVCGFTFFERYGIFELTHKVDKLLQTYKRQKFVVYKLRVAKDGQIFERNEVKNIWHSSQWLLSKPAAESVRMIFIRACL